MHQLLANKISLQSVASNYLYTECNRIYQTAFNVNHTGTSRIFFSTRSNFCSNIRAFTAIFGDIGSFTDHTYDYLGYAPGHSIPFGQLVRMQAILDYYAGIHYQPSVDTGFMQGRKVAANALRILNLH